MASRPLHDPVGQPLHGPGTEVRTTTCYMCACRCGIRVHLRDGEVRYIDGNPDAPAEQGRHLRQGRLRNHEAVLAGAPDQAAACAAPAASAAPTTSSRPAGTRRSRCSRRACRKLRATDPKRFALFTGRDQMQALTGLFARQFGTPNYAAHGGFCSVNMAAGMIYTIGGSFWEFGGPDLDRAQAVLHDRHRRGPPLEPAEGGDRRVQAQRRPASSRSTRCAPAMRPSPTSGSRSSRAPTARCCSRSSTRSSRLGSLRPDVPGPLHQRRTAGEPGPGQQRVRHDGAQRRRRHRSIRCARTISSGGTASASGRGRPHQGCRPGAARRVRAARRHAGQAGVPAARRAGRAAARRSGPRQSPASRRATIRRIAHEIGVTARDQQDRAADRLDRLVGQEARDRDRQPGRLPRDARPRRALQRLPDHPRRSRS